MILLAIDTSTRHAGVAIADGERVLAEEVWHSQQNHGAELLPAAMALLEQVGRGIRDLTHLAVALGPGGFSALRVGISTAKGLALPARLPVAGISSFDVEAAPHFGVDGPLYAVLPAGRGEVAWACYGEAAAAARQRTETGLASPEDLLARSPERARFCGEGALLLAVHAPAGSLLSGPPPTRWPGVLARLALDRFASGQVDDLDALEPIYARAPSISTPRPPR